MTVEEKLEIVRRIAGYLTEQEAADASEMLAVPYRPHAGSYSPAYVARWIQMHRATKNAAQGREAA